MPSNSLCVYRGRLGAYGTVTGRRISGSVTALAQMRISPDNLCVDGGAVRLGDSEVSARASVGIAGADREGLEARDRRRRDQGELERIAASP